MKYGTLEELTVRLDRLAATLPDVLEAAEQGDLAKTHELLGKWRYELGEMKVVVEMLGEKKWDLMT